MNNKSDLYVNWKDTEEYREMHTNDEQYYMIVELIKEDTEITEEERFIELNHLAETRERFLKEDQADRFASNYKGSKYEDNKNGDETK